jgi:restriction system protein
MPNNLTINEAILAVMKRAGTPLTPKEAYDLIIDKKLYEFHAQQPVNVVKGQIRRHCKDLDFPTAEPTKYFAMTSDGKYYPLKSPIRGSSHGRRPKERSKETSGSSTKTTLVSTLKSLKELQQLHKELIKERIIRDLKLLPPAAFEVFAKRLLEVYGFEGMRVTQVSNDGGIDGYGRLRVGLAHMKVAFQCKRWTAGNVGRPEIDKFRGAIQGEYEQGIFFTTSGFAIGAKEVSIKPGAVPVILIDGPSIANLMIDKGFGVQSEILPIYTYALDGVLAEDEAQKA